MKIDRTKLYLLFLPLVLTFGLWAQASGTLSGTVMNSSGTAVPNATVTITPASGGAGQKSLSGQDGTFSITGLPPGVYTVEVESAGYKRTAVQNIDLNATAPANLRLELEQGNTRETVEVKGSAVLLQAESGQTATAIASRSVSEIPVIDHNHQQLVDLEPGITPPQTNPSVVADPQQSRYWETNGLSNTTNRRMLDGVENGEPFTQGTVYLTPPSAVEQLNLVTSNYDAQSGRAAGTILNPVTRAGTNAIHGSLFEFNSNSALAARNFFNPKGYAQAHSNVNQTGGSIGGPIRRDKTFFFLDFEGDFARTQIPAVTTTPTDALRAGSFGGVPGLTLYDPGTGFANGNGRLPFPNNTIPSSVISPVARGLLPYFPEPNASGIQYNLLSNVPVSSDGYRGDVRLDHKMGEAFNLFARYSYAEYMSNQGSPLGVLGGSDGHLQNHNAMIGGTLSISPSFVGDLRLGYTRYANKLNSSYGGVTPASVGLVDPSAALFAASGYSNLGLPQIQIGGMRPFGTPAALPQYNVDNNYNLVNSWNVLTGRHNIHFGFDLYYIQAYGFQNYPFGPQGGYAFGSGATASPMGNGLGPYGDYANSFAGFLLGTPTQAGRNLPAYTPGYTTWQSSLYAGDTIKVTDRLTLDLGVRWEIFTPLALRHENGSYNYNPLTNQLNPLGGAVDNTGNMEMRWNNVAPRFGIAYRAPGRLVIRAGYGINYFAGPLNYYAGALITNPGISSGAQPGSFSTTGSLNQLPAIPAFTGSVAAPNTPLIYSPTNMKTPYVQNFDFLIEHDFGHYGLVASAGYVGNLGRQLPYSLETNAAAPGTGAFGQPFNTLAYNNRTASTVERLTGLTSNYNSLQAKLTKRFSNSLSFTAAYSYSRALDYGAGGVNPLLNNLSVASNYGPADWDRTHMFTLSHVWRLPIGADSNFLHEGVVGKILGPWQLDGMFHWMSGTPFTITADPTLCNCPGNTPTASPTSNGVSTGFVSAPTFSGFLPVPYQSLNLVYTQPPAGTLGNLGRNSVRGPGFANYDLSLFRSFVIREQAKFEFRAEAYNIANSTHFANPIANVNSAYFGQSISTLPYNADRRLQLGVRIVF